jgi:hypothetical protein
MSTEEREIKLNFTMNETYCLSLYGVYLSMHETRRIMDLKDENTLNKKDKHVEQKYVFILLIKLYKNVRTLNTILN